MLAIRDCKCAVPGCGGPIRLMPFVTVTEAFNQDEGLCRRCLASVDRDRRALLIQARFELRVSPHLAELLFFQRAWEVVRNQAVERASFRRVA